MEGKEIFGLEKRGESFITKNRCDNIKAVFLPQCGRNGNKIRQYFSRGVVEMGIK